MNNRTPLFILGALVLLAIIWRIASPPAPVPPGPLGEMPGWNSNNSLGDMGPSQVGPSGTMWAGAWNQKDNSGKLRSAVWVIDFEKEEPRTCRLEDGSYVSSLNWTDDNTIQVLVLDTIKPEDAGKSQIISIDAVTAEKKSSRELKTPVARMLAWGEGRMLAELADERSGQVAVLNPDGEIQGKVVQVGIKDARFGTVAAVSGDTFVFSEADADSGEPLYYMGNAQTGEFKQMFCVTDLPGRVDEILLSDNSSEDIGVVIYDGKNFDTLLFDCVTNKVSGSAGSQASKLWKTQPFSYVNYEGGFNYKHDASKPGKLFNFSKLGKRDKWWITYVQDGRIYKRKDGNFISVSQTGDLIDIRVINKDGTLRGNLLPRS